MVSHDSSPESFPKCATPPGRADVLVGTANETADEGPPTSPPSSPHSPGRADVPVGTANETADEEPPTSPTSPQHSPREWHSRGYLPHRDRAHLLQSITFRLADSLAQTHLKQLERKLKLLPEVRQDTEKRKEIEGWLDAGIGSCALRNPEAAACVQNALLHFDGERYRIMAWVIMPTHVHVLVDPIEPIHKTIQAWKSFTSRWLLANNHRLQLGLLNPHQVWMRDYWDRYIRDEDHLKATIEYIHKNPVKAGLCRQPSDWPWSSARIPRRADVLPGRADVLVGTANEKADEEPPTSPPSSPHTPGHADVPVGTANEKADEEPFTSPPSSPHSPAKGDLGAPGINPT